MHLFWYNEPVTRINFTEGQANLSSFKENLVKKTRKPKDILKMEIKNQIEKAEEQGHKRHWANTTSTASNLLSATKLCTPQH
jgi:hypothetical protein